uniref:NADH-ubiquinone oxidoreductase chain 5 n=1 Tax=Metacrangonyx longicaudus TaxID=1199243 RepID=K7ZWT4_9CRUS|nr:NADH dehydrogenase subunit 5 [Metacrangonyx longicaudus]CCI69453.1 NADH dehydrogenase subunit 5 [Metacrangonyx longicaudus]
MKINCMIYYIYMIIMSFISLISLLGFMYLMMNNKSLFLEWEFFFFGGGSMVFMIMFDWMSAVFMFTVSLISAVICGYSKYYMEGDKFYKRFMLILMLFISSMMLLILSPNMISLLLGWDGLGLSSYILVVYYQNEYACNSGMLTILSNRVGDAMILISICLMYMNNSWNFLLESSSSKLLLIMLILGAMTKSAQVPFSAWLPAAMAAPTPVSALVHSSTLVTAGVFLLIRFYPCYYNNNVYMYLLIMSSLTMIISGWMANFEMDMKKIIALSTLSQLGIMMMIMSMGLSELAFFHLITHAMFKSTIFMCAGIMIHNMGSGQDLRLVGNFFSSGPFLGLFFAVSNMSLCGFPYLAGFFSKDLLLENIFSHNMNFFFHMMSMLGTGLTISYSLRVMYFMSQNNMQMIYGIFKEMNMFLFKIMIIMMFMSILSGFFLSWMCFSNILFFVNLTSLSKFYIPMVMMIFFISSYNYEKKMIMAYNFYMNLWKKGSYLMMFLPHISSQLISTNSLKESYYFNKVFDQGWLEYMFGLNLYNTFSEINYNFMYNQISKFLKIFMITIFLSMIIFMNFM